MNESIIAMFNQFEAMSPLPIWADAVLFGVGFGVYRFFKKKKEQK